MITVGAGKILGAKADVAGVVNYAICGDIVSSSGDSFDVLSDGNLGLVSANILAPSAGQQALVKSIHFYNTHSARVTLSVYLSSLTRQIFQASIPIGGSAVWTPDAGWKIYDSTGSGSATGVKSDAGATTGLGPYTLSYTPDGKLLSIFLNGVRQLSTNYSIVGAALTFSGLDMTDYTNWAADYSY